MHDHDAFARRAGFSIEQNVTNVLCISVEDLTAELTPGQRAVLPQLRDSSIEITLWGTEFQKPVDVVIAALGWTFDETLFENVGGIDMDGPPGREERVYPKLSSEFESTNLQHLFVAGSAAHGRDRYRYKASGGFVHGYRHTVQALHRILETRYEDVVHPGKLTVTSYDTWFRWRFQNQTGVHFNGDPKELGKSVPLWGKLLTRFNEAVGSYAMVGGALADAIIYHGDNQSAWYVEDMPEDLIHERYSNYPRVMWSYYWGTEADGVFQTPCGLRSQRLGLVSEYIHPVLQYFPPKVVPPVPRQQYAGRLELAEGDKDSELGAAHPSTFWDVTPGVSRLHVKEQYIYLDWWDPGTYDGLRVFMNHAEAAAKDFYEKKSLGWITKEFDEKKDAELRMGYLQQEINEKVEGFDLDKCNNDEIVPVNS